MNMILDGSSAPGKGKSRKRLKAEWSAVTRVLAEFIEKRDLSDGYELGYPNDDAWRQTLVLFVEIAPERYPLFQIDLRTEPETQWLIVTGPEGVKDFIDGANYILNSSLNPRRSRSLRWRRAFQRATSPVRVLPDFLIFGAMKSGTTSLYAYLIEHPQVASATQKETYFFNANFKQGLFFYRSYFPTFLEKGLGRLRGRWLTGEATPFYIYHPQAPGRIYSLLPEIRLIAILRNPIDRAYSHYHHRSRMGLEPLTFAEAVEREEERLYNKLTPEAPANALNVRLVAHGYTTLGLYGEQLARWFELFEREQILVLTTEALQERPVETFHQATDFLGLTDWSPTQFKKLNKAPYEPMETAVRQKLAAFYRPYNQKLYELLGKDLGWD